MIRPECAVSSEPRFGQRQEVSELDLPFNA
jgi:hypothetical protein